MFLKMAQGLQGQAIVFIKLTNIAKGEKKGPPFRYATPPPPAPFRPEIKAVTFKPSVDHSSHDGVIFQPFWYSSENNVIPPWEPRPTVCRSDTSEPARY